MKAASLVQSSREVGNIPASPIAKYFFADTRMAWVWLIVRVYVGYEWLTAGWEKLTGYSIKFDSFGEMSPGGSWIFGAHPGAGMSSFAISAVKKAVGDHPSVQGWYAAFLDNVVLSNTGIFTYLITFGELFVGIGLIVGALTGIAAIFGLFMNLNYLLAGAVSINPILGLFALLLVLAWRIAGYIGVDRYFLPLVGTPWTGSLYKLRVTNSAGGESSSDNSSLA